MSPAARIQGAVALGSAFGSVARYAVSIVLAQDSASSFPWATLAVNVLGSVAIAFYATVSAPGGRVPVSLPRRQFFMAGFCGGFTTFSVFSVETVLLASGERPLLAVGYVLASLLLWIPGAALGHVFAQKLNRLPRGSHEAL